MIEPTDRLRRYGEDIASAVSPARSRVAAMRAIGQARRTRPRRTRQLAFAALGVFVVANVVTAGVANAAVPGDVLYSLDRGYERVADVFGLGGDHGEERISEAEVLLQRSEVEGAIDLIAEAANLEAARAAAAGLHSFDPADPTLPGHVQALVDHVHALVEARREGEPQRAAEAEAAVDLVATQIGEQVRASRADETGPPDHANEQDPPDPGPNVSVPPEPGQGPPDGAGEPQRPASPPGNDPPAPTGQEKSGGNQDGASGNGSKDDSSQPGSDQSVPADTRPGRNGGRADR